ncbi:MAG: hypothetical protein LUC83_08705 [Clostridiales bacterium]|nr:hypothetical protein [Clostridiales bacterium]
MNKKKIITTASAIALAAVLAFGGTLAYYQDDADEDVSNTWVDQGNSVSITESDVDGNGSTQSNTYSIIPGTTDKKDPVVKAEYTLDSYVYVKADDTTGDFITWAIANGWTKLGEGYDGVYYMLLKTIQYDETTWVNYSYTDSEKKLVYSYDSTSATYTVKNSSETTLYTYTVETNSNGIEVYTASIPVILNETVTYSSEITNDTFKDYGSTVSLDFTAYIIEASLTDGTDGNDNYGEEEYSSAQQAYYYVNSEDYYEAAATNGNVAAINGTLYDTLGEAVTAASATETVTLLVDINKNTEVEGNTTIDLNGHYVGDATKNDDGTYNWLRLSGTITLMDSGNSETATTLYATTGLDLTIESGNYSKINYQNSTTNYSSLVVNGGTLNSLTTSQNGATVINGGTINYLNVSGSVNKNPTTTINGGSFPGGANTSYPNYSVIIGSYGVLNINGGTFGKAIQLNESCSLTVTDGTFDGFIMYGTSGNCDKSTAMTATISGGTFNGYIYVRRGSMDISGGTFNSYITVAADGVTYTSSTSTWSASSNTCGHLEITGGTFNDSVAYGTTTKSGGTVTHDEFGATIVAEGGTFKNDPASYVDTESYTVTKNDDGTYTVSAGSSDSTSDE